MVELLPEVAAAVKSEPPLTKQVEHPISPAAERVIGEEADTAMVPEAFGMVKVRVVPVVIPESWKVSFLVVSPSSAKSTEASVKVLLVKVSVVARPTKVSVEVGSVKVPVLII